VAASVDSAMFKKGYANVFKGDANWGAIKTPEGKIYAWDGKSTYVKNPPYFDGMTMTPARLATSRERAHWRCSVIRHHRPHFARRQYFQVEPAAKYLMVQGVQAVDFNSTVRAVATMKS